MALVSVAFLLFLLLLSVHVRAQQNQSHVIRLGASLSPNATTPWLSPSGIFAFGFHPQGDGFAVGIWLVSQPENTIVWTANRDDPPVSLNSKIEFTTDGELILRTAQGEEKPIADVSEPADSASMLDSGNFVLHGNNSSVIWESFDFPTDTILGGQNLSADNRLVSSMSRSDHSSGRYFLTMQADGNLVAYPANNSTAPEDAYWASGTFGFPNTDLSLNTRGILGLNSQSSSVRILGRSSYPCEYEKTIYRATMDADGIFRLYSHCFERNTSSTKWEWWALNNRCDVKGVCGLNSYCSGMGAKAVCLCYPGFGFINTSERSLDCYSNIGEDECRSEKDSVKLYNVTVMENTSWVEYPYSVVAMKKEDCGQSCLEDCGKSCLEDCDCGAALYRGEYCEKHTPPLRYGRRNPYISTTAFFKEISISTKSANHTSPAPAGPTIVIEGKKKLILILALSLGSIACLCIVMAIYSFFIYRHRVHQYRKLSKSANLRLPGEFALQSFSFDELEKATDGFKEELGRGSFGAVYKGKISEGNKTVAIKRLVKIAEEGERKFRAEMTVIGRTHHRNLVRLLGFCVEGSRKLLVYEYMSNGSLADYLFKSEKRPSWKERVRIALDVARGIVYLHEECEVHIIHCNIKPQNVLMDDSWTAKISDFGLAKLLLPNQIKTTMDHRGTKGHLAPEWQNDALVSVKTDIYSFGVLLLEIICCRRSIDVDVSTADEIILSSWAYDCFLAGKLDILVEDEDIDLKTLERMVKVGLWCVQDDPDLRPSMKNVILMLEGTVNISVPPSPALSLVTS